MDVGLLLFHHQADAKGNKNCTQGAIKPKTKFFIVAQRVGQALPGQNQRWLNKGGNHDYQAAMQK